MKLIFSIAWRYLIGKKSTQAINLITFISMLGLTVGTAALLLILSVFNGFEDLISKLMNAYNPDLKVVAAEGLFLELDSTQLARVGSIPGIKQWSESLETVVLFDYDGSQEAGIVKGVDNNYRKVTNIDSTIVRGEYVTTQGNTNFAILGSGMFNKLSINPSDPLTPVMAYAALKSKGPLSKDYATLELYPAGVFTVGSEEDMQYVLTDIQAVRELIQRPTATSSLEIDLEEQADVKGIRAALVSLLGQQITIKDRYEQDEAFLRIMNIEKWIAYLIACLTLGLISFNLIGALWMIVLEKKRDISVLKSMGFTNPLVRKLVMQLGILIGIMGLGFGLMLASVLYWLQKNYDLVEVPPGFMIDAYPIAFRWQDFVLVSFTVVFLAWIASVLPAYRASRISAFVRHE
ncbi:MAG: ABC transporter permease [Saprospiraceae bacterium]|nr:ABC transporter permease [Saprospiraceae bacterium]MBK7219927.1 ABC transporter permease [Saprospiraceae bacterium]MBK8849550.1 ABC transporter permease [Saprospiraceae bacterium]MBK9687230.1 ABC transporter permease [Saprospiraceae bacterium]